MKQSHRLSDFHKEDSVLMLFPAADSLMSLSITEALLAASRTLHEAGVPEPRREAGSLLAFVTGKGRTFLISHPEHLLSDAQLLAFDQCVERRIAGEPQQYITGVQDFFGRAFKVTPDVLIPRPETELLVAAALGLMKNVIGPPIICDVGTGSGCIAVSLLCEMKNARVLAVDISREALQVAKENATAYGVINRLSLLVSDCFASVPANSRFDLIVSNPPYVSADAVEGLQREVKNFEPRVALTPGRDGLAIVRRLLNESPQFLVAQGYLIFEMGFDQGEAIRSLIRPPWTLLDILPDLQGIPRIALLQKTDNINS